MYIKHDLGASMCRNRFIVMLNVTASVIIMLLSINYPHFIFLQNKLWTDYVFTDQITFARMNFSTIDQSGKIETNYILRVLRGVNRYNFPTVTITKAVGNTRG